jgi:hypothetical protein
LRNIIDLATGMELTGVKALSENNAGSGEARIAGLRWALDQKIKLTNMRLATSKKNLSLN